MVSSSAPRERIYLLSVGRRRCNGLPLALKGLLNNDGGRTRPLIAVIGIDVRPSLHGHRYDLRSTIGPVDDDSGQGRDLNCVTGFALCPIGVVDQQGEQYLEVALVVDRGRAENTAKLLQPRIPRVYHHALPVLGPA